MRKAIAVSAMLAFVALSPAYAQDDKAKDWCTDAHMKTMDAEVGKITDATKKKAVQGHLDASKAAFKKNDMAGCVKSMEAAHKAMGS